MKLKNIIYPVLATAALAACSPEDFHLGGKDVSSSDLVEGSAYTLEVDQSTNVVTMTSLMPSNYNIIWDYDGGHSQDPVKKVSYPFEGKKYVVFGVETRGGIVYGDTAWVTINKTNPELLTGDLWGYIAGGVGKKKRWVPDIDVAGGTYASIYFTGALSFAGTDDTWNTYYLKQAAPEGADSWSWDADYAGNSSWMFGDPTVAPNGYMEFDLQDGANVTVYDANTNTTTKGTYMMDCDNHTMSLNGVGLLHDPGRDAIVTKWGNITIMSMTEHTMQLAVLRDNSSEGNCLLIYNFVEEGWVPETTTGGSSFVDVDAINANVSLTTTTSLTWQLNADAPYDWYWFDASDGTWKSNGFSSSDDYAKTTWAPVADEDEVSEFSLFMTRSSVDKTEGQYLLKNNKGKSYEGNYSSDGSWITFDKDVTLLTVSKASTSTEVDNSWDLSIHGKKFRVVQNTDDGIWLGMPSQEDNEGNVTAYACVLLKKKSGNTSDVVVYRSINVDGSKVRYGDLEGKGNFRIQFYNEYGGDLAKGSNAAVDYNDVYCKKECIVNFTVSGLGTFAKEVDAFIMNSSQGYWDASEGVNTFKFKGDGTYEVTSTGKGTVSDGLVFLIDCVNAQAQCPDIQLNGDIDTSTNRLKGVTVTINSIKFY